METVLEIDNRKVGFKATALTPRIYRHVIGRDMISDMNRLTKAYKKAEQAKTDEEKMDAQLSVMDLEIFENAAWVMAKQYDSEIEKTPDEWLDTFKMFSVYKILPEIIKLWGMNNATTSFVKKN